MSLPTSLPESLFGELLESAPDGIIVVDDAGAIVYTNQQVEWLFGHPRGSLLGQPIERLIPERFHGRHQGHREAYVADPRPRPMGQGLQLFGRRADGTDFPVEISLSPVVADGNRWFMAAIRDVSERLEIEGRERRVEATFQAVLEAAPDGLVIVGDDGGITIINQQAEAMFGYPRDEIIGQPIEVLIPERMRGQHVGHRTRFMGESRARPMGAGLALFAQRKDGSEFPVEISLSPVDVEGEHMVIAAVRDISERKRLERREATAAHAEAEMQRLRERDVFKTQFINDAAHELNTPLTPLLMQIRIISEADQGNLTDLQRSSLETLQRNAERFARLVGDLLDAGRFQGGHLAMHPEPIDLAELLQLIGDDHRPMFHEAAINLVVELPTGLPVNVDADRIRQVVDNLLGNALKFSAQGTVRLSAAKAGREVVVTVSDEGAGLTKEQAARLFQPFSRVHDQTTGPAGTGLGLYLCKALVEMHGGSISVSSRGPGKGAAFSFTLRLRQ